MQNAIYGATLVGVEAIPVAVEVDVAGGLPSVAVVGLAEAAVREARVRVQAALQNSGHAFPAGRVTVNLAPAHLKKDGTGFDLPIALGVLSAQGVIPPGACARTLVFAELSLSGEVRPVRGALAAAEAARRAGLSRILVAPEDGGEAALVGGLEVRCVRHFRDAVRYLRDRQEDAAPLATPRSGSAERSEGADLADVRGQPFARRALEVAAAGGHNLLFVGGPGSGKTMLARRLPGILPPLSDDEAMEVTRIHSVAGLGGGGLLRTRPFRAPHHSTTPAGLIGGGSGHLRPGELSLAHRGVLFLDELPEFPRATLEVLRQPLESGEVSVVRASGSVRFPACAIVVAAMNPCPCGYLGVPGRRCVCPIREVQRYRRRVSGPLLDRIDLHVEVAPVKLSALEDKACGEPSAAVRARVEAARARQAARLGEGRTNAQMTPAEARAHAAPDEEGRLLLAAAVEELGLSARAYERTLKVARTIADLEGAERVRGHHVAEALAFRQTEPEAPGFSRFL